MCLTFFLLSVCFTDSFSFVLFFFNDTATTEIYTLSLHDALPIGNATIIPPSRLPWAGPAPPRCSEDRKSTRLNSSHEWISYAVFCLKKKIDVPRFPGKPRYSCVRRNRSPAASGPRIAGADSVSFSFPPQPPRSILFPYTTLFR